MHGSRDLGTDPLKVVDDPRHVCTQWQSLKGSVPLRPMWSVRFDRDGAVTAKQELPKDCGQYSTGLCSASSPVLRWCAIAVHRAVVLPSGLVVNGTHRFDLKLSHQAAESGWSAGYTPGQACKHRMRSHRHLWSFRQLFADNPLHSLFQVLPLMTMALHLFEQDANATVLAPSRMFKALAEQMLSPERVLHTNVAVAADWVHLVVGHPPFSPLYQTFAAGCLRRLRITAPPLPPTTAPGTTVLFLPRGSDSGARQGVRDFRNQPAIIAATRTLLKKHTHAQLQLFEFRGSLKQQRRAFETASVVVGPQGTSFSGLAFCRRGVTIIEWALRRDEDWALTEYLALGADYYQLMPRWHIASSVTACNTSRVMDDCPWHLNPADIDLYVRLLDAILSGRGPAMTRAGSHGASPKVRLRSPEMNMRLEAKYRDDARHHTMKLLSVERSKRDKKKYVATFDNGEQIHFGHVDYKDYTAHHDEERRDTYRKSHEGGHTAFPNSAAALEYHLLWGNSTSLQENVEKFKSAYGV